MHHHLLPLLLSALLAGCASTVSSTAAAPDATPDASVALSPDAPVIELASAGPAACALRRDGRVRCWRWFVTPSTEAAQTPREVAELSDAMHVAVFSNVDGACAVRRGGEIRCWSSDPRSGPAVTDHRLDRPAVAIAAGGAHACALDELGAVWCWGLNEGGQLGTGDLSPRQTPSRVEGLEPAVELRAGESNTCARTRDGSVWCWGRNFAGALGDGLSRHDCPAGLPDEDCSARPVRVASLRAATALSVGLNGACAVEGGVPLCWGWGSGGRLGDTTETSRSAPTPVAGLDHVASVFAGYLGGCALREGGALLCWGLDFGDAVPDGGVNPRLGPTAIDALPAVVAVSGGWYHKCALRSDGAVWCWGGSGANGRVPRERPMRVEGL